jgi:beta-glucosidase
MRLFDVKFARLGRVFRRKADQQGWQKTNKRRSVQFDTRGKFDTENIPAEIGIIVLSEPPYAEGAGDRADLNLIPDDIALIQRMHQQCEKLVVILYSGRPLIITNQLPLMDALVAAWLPGTEAQGIADVLFGDFPFTGNLSFTWPRSMDQILLNTTNENDGGPLFVYGYGLKTITA